MDQSTQTRPAAAPTGDTLRQTDEQRAASRALSLRAPETPGVSPGYEMIRRLGAGSFGAVWLAREIKTGKQVAIKFYSHRRGLDWSLLTREVEKLAVLYTSRDIVGLLDVGWDHDPPYFVMEFLEHGSLQTRLQNGPLPVETAVSIATSIARALVHAHGSGILHCDLKPANILLDNSDEPRLGDFGQSRLTTEQSPALGTMYYMAPEQADLNAVPDARWDVYALGALLYEMLAGTPPYRSPETERRLSAVSALDDRLSVYRDEIRKAPRPRAHRNVRGVDRRLAEIVDGCLQPDPQERLPNAQVVLDRLEQRTAIRSRRPLIAVGFLAPVLFMLAMFWIARTAGSSAVDAAQANLIDRTLAGDSVSAHLLADGIQQDVASRQERAETLARSPAARIIAAVLDGHPDLEGDSEEQIQQRREFLLQRMEGPANGDAVQQAYADIVAQIAANERHLKELGRTPNVSWFIVGTQGRQVLRIPPRKPDGEPQDTLGNSFHWRAYYTGRAEDLPKQTPFADVAARTEPGVSPYFRSEGTKQYMVAIAAPVWDDPQLDGNPPEGAPSGQRRVIGVIGCSIHIADLLQQWENMIDEPEPDTTPGHDDRFLALATFHPSNSDGTVMLLDHPWMTPANLEQVAPKTDTEDVRNKKLDAFMSGLRLEDEETRELTDLMRGQGRDHRESRQYIDPFGRLDPAEFGGEWLAAFSRVGQTEWIAIVQERRKTATEPVQSVNAIFAKASVVAIIVFGVLLAILWYFLNRASVRR